MPANMIDQHFDHPSISLWGLGNEDDRPTEYPSIDHAAIRASMQEMNTLSHALDPSRVTSIRDCNFSRDISEVACPPAHLVGYARLMLIAAS
jgi:beta-galactosidase